MISISANKVGVVKSIMKTVVIIVISIEQY